MERRMLTLVVTPAGTLLTLLQSRPYTELLRTTPSSVICAPADCDRRPHAPRPIG